MSNPHADGAIDALNYLGEHAEHGNVSEAEALATIQAQATLALAYEQHTQNLIAFLVSGTRPVGVDLNSQIIDRLGLNAEVKA